MSHELMKEQPLNNKKKTLWEVLGHKTSTFQFSLPALFPCHVFTCADQFINSRLNQVSGTNSKAITCMYNVGLTTYLKDVVAFFSTVIFAFNVLIIKSTLIAAKRDLATVESRYNIDFQMLVCISQQHLCTYKNDNTKHCRLQCLCTAAKSSNTLPCSLFHYQLVCVNVHTRTQYSLK